MGFLVRTSICREIPVPVPEVANPQRLVRPEDRPGLNPDGDRGDNLVRRRVDSGQRVRRHRDGRLFVAHDDEGQNRDRKADGTEREEYERAARATHGPGVVGGGRLDAPRGGRSRGRCELGIVLQDRALELPQLWPGLDTEVVGQSPTGVAIRLERLALPSVEVQRTHQLPA